MQKTPCSYELLNENSEDYLRTKFAHKLSINHIRESRMTSRARSVRPRGLLPMTYLSKQSLPFLSIDTTIGN